MKTHSAIAILAAALIGGCTMVEPIDYARTLCDTVPRDQYSACASRVLEHYRVSSWETRLPLGHSTSGPLAMVVGERLYLGHYDSSPWSARFRVTAGEEVCHGAYDALAGSSQAILAVRCSTGRQGTADLVLDQRGRNGTGTVEFNDGAKGAIVFGHAAAGAMVRGES